MVTLPIRFPLAFRTHRVAEQIRRPTRSGRVEGESQIPVPLSINTSRVYKFSPWPPSQARAVKPNQAQLCGDKEASALQESSMRSERPKRAMPDKNVALPMHEENLIL